MADYILTDNNDPRMDIQIMSKEKIDNFHNLPELLHSDCLDYGIKVKSHDELLDSVLPISVMNIKTLDDAREFYSNKHPQLPDEYYDIMAKYHFGEKFTKKQLKNEVKRVKKGKKSKELDGLKIVKNKVLVNFD
mgnify:FL=1|tara:strand:+ start:281 stop:682 length:402 start_codon:yes stop_codon:yes gene_type:complete